jgi:hypothetical protein
MIETGDGANLMSIVREYEYKPRWKPIVLGIAFFGLAAVFLGSEAAHNDRGLVINRFIELGPEGATAFYWMLTACGVGFVVIGVLLAHHRTTYQQRLVFGTAAVTVPASRWSREVKEIVYREIWKLSTATVGSQRFLYVLYAGGRYTITAAMLPSTELFEEVCELLTAKVQEALAIEQGAASSSVAFKGKEDIAN